MSRVAIIGLGYVGLTTAVGLARLGHQVLGFDVSSERIGLLREGKSPIFEENLESELASLVSDKTLTVTDSSSELADFQAEFLFICVATPQDQAGSADLSIVFDVLKSISDTAASNSVVVTKSTVPIGTGAQLQARLGRQDVFIASNPEFLREGTALKDFMEPDRIVAGANSPGVAERVLGLYSKIETAKIATSLESAELIKYSSNSYLAMRLSYANDIAALAERSGANVEDVLKGMGLDKRIGTAFLNPGPGWGGSCFPKDTQALLASARNIGMELPLVAAAINSNWNAIHRVIETITEIVGGSLQDKTIAIWGIAFKANTDDTRDSPAVAAMRLLVEKGSKLKAYDPVAKAPADLIQFQVCSAIDSVTGADCLVVLTEWSEFSAIDPQAVSSVMRNSAVCDTRRILPEIWKSSFSTFRALGDAKT
jgi:UDPglucose 6-dehydrogenase